MSDNQDMKMEFPVKFKFSGPIIFGLVLAVLAVIALFSSIYSVDQTERAVVLRFGAFHSINSPGLHFKLPFGIDRNYNVQTEKVQQMEFGYRTEKAGIKSLRSSRDYPEESIMLSGDLNIIDVEWVIQYRITDPKAWLFNVENRTKTIRDITQSVINSLIGDRGIMTIMSEDRQSINNMAQEQLNKVFSGYNLGVSIGLVKLGNVNPPAGPVREAFESVNKAVQKRESLINEGELEYNRAIPEAKGKAERLIAEARGYAQKRINQAKGDVARFISVYEEYRKNPAVTRTRLYYEMIEDVFGEEKNVDLIDKNLSNFIPFKTLKEKGGNQ